MTLHEPHKDQKRKNEAGKAVMSRLGLARTMPQAHQQCQIARRSLNQKFLVHVLSAAHPQPIHASGVELVREVPLDPLSPLPLQLLAAIALNPPAIAIYRRL